MKAFYSRPISLFGSKQEQRDIELIEKLGYSVIDYKTEEIQNDYKQRGMIVFEEIVKESDILFFRSFVDLKIGSGVLKEIQMAINSDIPVFELPTLIKSRHLDVDQTREYLTYLGYR